MKRMETKKKNDEKQVETSGRYIRIDINCCCVWTCGLPITNIRLPFRG